MNTVADWSIGYEAMEACAHIIGVAPNRTFIGDALDQDDEPYIVIWNERTGDKAFVQARYVHLLVKAAMMVANTDWERHLAEHPEYFAGEMK